MSASEAGQTLYDAVGGMAFFEALVDASTMASRPTRRFAGSTRSRTTSARPGGG